MSGIRQHFIPRFLQNGFVSRVVGDQIYTWVFTKDRPTFETNTINSGVSKFFYTEKDNSETDDIITDLEKSFYELVQSIRSGSKVALSDILLPDFFAHMEVRTKHFRSSFHNASEYMIEKLLDFAADEQKFEPYFTKLILSKPTIMKDAIKKQLDKYGINAEYHKDLSKQIENLPPLVMSNLQPHIKPMLEEFRANMPGLLKTAVKSGHNNALASCLNQLKPRADKYSQLNFEIKTWPDEDLILGDSAVLFKIESDLRPFRACVDKDQKVIQAFLPISRTQILVGSRDADNSGFSSAEVKEAIARCSMEFFIGAAKTEENLSLTNTIGKEASIIGDEELESIVNDLWDLNSL